MTTQTTKPDPEAVLRAFWTARGLPVEQQDQIIAKIKELARPGARVGPFVVDGDRHKLVTVTVNGGLVQHVEVPAGVIVYVRDYDNGAIDPDAFEDTCGARYTETIWREGDQ